MSQPKKFTGKNNAADVESRQGDFIKIPNPYRAYDIETGRWFYHEDVIEKVKMEFESSPPRKVIVIHGFIGSGKTSTLLRMVEEPGMLGQRYVPIYIDPGHTADLDTGTLLLFVYKAIKDALNILGLSIDEPNYSFQSSLSFDQMVHFTASLGNKLADNIILLIFDDFGKMQQKAVPAALNDIFRFFDYVLHKTNMFRLILAGKGDIFKSSQGTDMSGLLNAAFKIELGMFLERKKIEDLIVAPVKEYVKYEPEAIHEIVRKTGRNLYCQQLLCYYIIEHLNEMKRHVCSGDDVRGAVYKTISDKREDFVYFWNNLPYDYKLVLAALADENVMKKEGRFYFMKESPLLDSILSQPALNELLDRLHEEQHINKIKGRRFDGEPFMLPLYGEWVKKRHPLVQTVVENWKTIVDHVSLSGLGKIMEFIPIENLPFEKDIARTAIMLSKKWSTIKTNLKQGNIDKKQLNELVHMICSILRCEIKEEPGDRKNVYIVNMNRLQLSGLENVLVFVIPRFEFTDNDIQYIQDEILLEDKPSFPSFILCFKKTDKITQFVQKPFLGIVLIEEDDLKRCVLSPTPLQVFRKDVLIRQIRPSVVSPYKTEGPVRVTFYGRQDEIGRILGKKERNFAIVGARKIGKTSLLFKIISEMPPATMPIYLDLEAPEQQNYTSFLSVLQDKIKEKYNQDVTFDSDLHNFSPVIKRLNQTGKKPIFLLDEADILLKFDEANDYKLLTIFRALAQERYCQVIISGFKKLYLSKMDIGSPLYNFLEIITLDKLKKDDAIALISEPMESIGIKYNNPEDKMLILQHTSRHPNLLQFFCKSLVERIQDKDDKKNRRTIYRTDIEELFETFDYEKYVINDFYLFFTEDFGSIERLIILLLLKNYPDKDIFSAAEIKEILNANGISITLGELAEYLAGLRLRYIFLAEKGGNYRFALPIFPRILKRYELDNLIKEANKDAKKSL
ncbi:MAG: AAA family ATPase [Candidatus Aminicenantes bacterium]|nr:MAG: AAA family ATPase [Candidatus Aminicenantes bacterium]